MSFKVVLILYNSCNADSIFPMLKIISRSMNLKVDGTCRLLCEINEHNLDSPLNIKTKV